MANLDFPQTYVTTSSNILTWNMFESTVMHMYDFDLKMHNDSPGSALYNRNCMHDLTDRGDECNPEYY